MDQRQIVVETGLDETVEWPRQTNRLHARTRFVEKPKSVEPPRLPELGDPWCPLTVRARLERMGETYRRLPHSPDTRPGGYKSCMPTPLRELFKDLPAEPLRPGVTDVDLKAANQVIDVLTESERSIAWALANKWGDRKLARAMRCHHATAAKAKQDVLAQLVTHWNTLDWKPDAEDVKRASRFIHRKFD